MKLSIASFFCFLASSLWGADPRNERSRPILIPAISAPIPVQVNLDKDVFRHSPEGFGDLRVRDSRGVAQSHLQTRPTQILSETRKAVFKGKTLSAMPLEGGGFQIEVEISDDAPKPKGLRINTPLSDFENKVTVFGLKKQGGETKLAEGLLVDYRSVVDYRVDSISFDAGEYKKFRIVVAKPTIQQESALMELGRRAGAPQSERLNILRRPFRIESVEFYTTSDVVVGEQPIRDEVPPEAFVTLVDKATKTTIAEFETDGGPFVGVEIFPLSTNFRRKARLEYGTQVHGSKGDSPQKEPQIKWTIAAQGTISSLDFQGHKSRNTRLECGESRQTKWRFVIENEDSPPVEVGQIKTLMSKVCLVFLALPGETYRLQYGDSQASPPVFDTAAIQEMVKKATPLVGQLGEVQTRELPPEEKPAESLAQWLMRQKALFGVIVLFLALFLGITLYQTAKRLNTGSETPPGG